MEDFSIGKWYPPEGVELPENVYISANGDTYGYRPTPTATKLIPRIEAERMGRLPSKDYKKYIEKLYRRKLEDERKNQ